MPLPPSLTRPVYTLVGLLRSLLTDPHYFYELAALIVFGDAVLTQIIIRFVPYTEIDWETYIYQLELYLEGERDYALIVGPTGPIVYPAGHLYIHRFLYAITNSGQNLAVAQQVYGLLYLALLATTCVIYRQAGGVPNIILLLLPFSKRLHSIFVLRLFNDCWNVFCAHTAVLAYAIGWDVLGTLLLGCSLSVKMSALLYLPGLVVVLFKRHGFLSTLGHMFALILSQIVIGLPFLLQHPWSYLKFSYELSRTFLYKWTVNWRFISKETFLGSAWAKGLLFGHITTLVAFGLFKWCKDDGGVWYVVTQGLRHPLHRPAIPPVTADFVITVLFTSNLIGILFSRSLHYQFYSWYALQVPFLAWRTRYPGIIKLAIPLAVEYAWNVFPSTPLSSGVLGGANALLVFGLWFGYPEGKKNGSHKSE